MKNKKEKRKYGRISCLCWAMQKLWRLDKWFVFFIFASVPFSVALPLAESYFSKVLIDRIGNGAPFSELAAVVVTLLFGILALQTVKHWVDVQCLSWQYYPSLLYQSEIAAFENAVTDFENTEKKDFKELRGYAVRDANGGNCSPEFLWRDLSAALIHLTGIFTYASLLVSLHPVIFVAVTVTSALSYFTTRWQPIYHEKNKHKWEEEGRKRYICKVLARISAKQRTSSSTDWNRC